MSASPILTPPIVGRREEWTGRWVTERLGAAVETTAAPFGITIPDLLGLALRRNPNRPHLLVSHVLGKHVPADPRLVYGVGLLLGEAVRSQLTGQSAASGLDDALRAFLAGSATALRAALSDVSDVRHPIDAGPAVVLGYAETATALGHAVADRLGTAVCLHSTRRAVPGAASIGGFLEEHSHATEHWLLPRRPELLLNDLPLILVDDEHSTGMTAMNTITLLHRRHPRAQYLIATLVDVRSPENRDRMAETAEALGIRIDVVALATGRITFAGDAADRARESISEFATPIGRAMAVPTTRGNMRRIDIGWPTDLPETGRHGFEPSDRRRLDAGIDAMVDRLQPALPPSAGLLVLGVEELMYGPLRLAVGLADRLDPRCSGDRVGFSTTTRSPILPVNDAGYAIRSEMRFSAHDTGTDGGIRYAYNVDFGGHDAVLLVLDKASDTPAAHGLIRQLTARFQRVLLTTIGRSE